MALQVENPHTQPFSRGEGSRRGLRTGKCARPTGAED